jgi:hypothetical protein
MYMGKHLDMFWYDKSVIWIKSVAIVLLQPSHQKHNFLSQWYRNFTDDGKSYLDEKLKSLHIDTVVIVSEIMVYFMSGTDIALWHLTSFISTDTTL